MEILRNVLHTFSSKIKIFTLVTLWTDNKVSHKWQFSLLLLKRHGKTLYVQQQEGKVYVLPASPEGTCMRSM